MLENQQQSNGAAYRTRTCDPLITNERFCGIAEGKSSGTDQEYRGTQGERGPDFDSLTDHDEWGGQRPTNRYSWQNYSRPDPELAMIDHKRAQREALADRLPGETLHAALVRHKLANDNGRGYAGETARERMR